MAVYERSYRDYEGALTPEWARFLVIPRYAYQQVFASRFFVVFLVLCYLYPLFSAVMIYIPHNLKFLEVFQLEPGDINRFIEQFVFPIRFMYWQGTMSFLLVFFVGPALISSDMRNNALPLYLSRPFSRSEYVLGKLAVLAILLSAITWVPGLLLWALQSYLMGWQWFLGNLRVGIAIFVGAWIWILVLSLLSLAISAYVKWKPIARIALFAGFFFGAPFGGMVNIFFGTNLGRMFNFTDMMHVVWGRLFGEELFFDFPIGGALFSLLGLCALCMVLLARKVKAYEVVRS